MFKIKGATFLFLIFLFANSFSWQQQVEYTISAQLFPKEHKIEAKQTLIYTNNSPDTLRKVYFHLYLNAFQPGSYMDIASRRMADYDLAGLPENEWGKQEIKVLKVDGQDVTDFVINNTILELNLLKPLTPQNKMEFYFEFTDQVPVDGGRMGHRGKHYDIGQWYPKIAVYDHKGWHNDQYLSFGEFYGDFGSFKVDFTFPKEYIVGHTGVLLNEKEIYPDLPQASEDTVLIDILKKYQEKKDTLQKQIVVTPEKNHGEYLKEDDSPSVSDTIKKEKEPETVTWKMYAENVHDFALSADPNFIWDRAQWEDVTINVLYTKESKKYWEKNAALFSKFSIEFFSKTFGRYPYSHYTTVAGNVGGGMEYFNLTFINKKIGSDYNHSLFGVIAHEIGHNWFYGLIGSNETKQPFMDEGFTTFATILAQEAYYGRYDNEYTWKKWHQKTFYSNDDDRARSARSYIVYAKRGLDEATDTPADKFLNPGAMRIGSYAKTASVLFMLQYALGDSVFDYGMREYYHRWHYKHPYKEDFQKVMEDVSGQKLEWFFKQWWDRTYTCDYGIKKIKNKSTADKKGNFVQTEILLERKGPAIMPVDIALKLKSGETRTEKIPVEAWMNDEKEHKLSLNLPAKVVSAEINPDQRLMDINRLDNSWPLPKMKIDYDYFGKYNPNPTEAYQFLFRPSFWYNDLDGLKTGFRLKGTYLKYEHNLDLALWEGLNSGKFNYEAAFHEPALWLGTGTNFQLKSYYLDGRAGWEASLWRDLMKGFQPQTRRGTTFGAKFKQVLLKDGNYLPVGSDWSSGKINLVNFFFTYRKPYRLFSTDAKISLNSSTLGSDFAYSKSYAELKGSWWGIPGHTFSARIAGGYSSGSVPVQDKFYLAGASPLEEFDNPWYRSKGTLPHDWKKNAHLYLPGGGNVRGYLNQNVSGNKLLALNLKWGFPNPLSLLPHNIPYVSKELNSIKPEVFFDFGNVWDTKRAPQFNDFASDLGVGLSYTIPYLNQLLLENQIRFDFPLWVDNPKGSENQVKFRWIFSLGAGI
ncbi:MAG: aminopeptidase N [candidate division Zixibacteria bacterium RBG-1]|nr:MAG: aminopeptidase N [candidate division Zixibacteria bacterium RBG-1]OGC84830.1 MAG: hypothetical protein A2V73_00120 [candidate division Zixibacteria bacterium RBG_19FT_COMBO_42_43]